MQFGNLTEPDQSKNFQHLFNLTGPTEGSDPGPGSLYNVTTLKALLDAGENSGNIMVDQTITFEDAVKARLDTWRSLSLYTGFCNKTGDVVKVQDCEVKEVYMMYLWMDTLVKETFQREREGGDVEMGVIPTLGSTAFKQYMEYMSLELPLIVHAHAFEQEQT